MLDFVGFDGVFEGDLGCFDVGESGEIVDFSGFYRSWYRSDFGCFGMGIELR